MKLLEPYLQQIRALCKQHNVKSLYVFGSILTPRFSPSSDIDLVVDFNTADGFDYVDNYISFKENLSSLFQRPVDLLEQNGIRNKYLRSNIDHTKQLIYG